MINTIVRKHITAIKEDLSNAKILKQLTNSDHKELVPEIFTSTIIKMCIEYESFTTEAYDFVFPKDTLKYNHPWRYTRELSSKLNINIKNEYRKAHEGWEIYNTLKHLNKRMIVSREKISLKENLKSVEEMAIFIHDALIKLLEKFIV